MNIERYSLGIRVTYLPGYSWGVMPSIRTYVRRFFDTATGDVVSIETAAARLGISPGNVLSRRLLDEPETAVDLTGIPELLASHREILERMAHEYVRCARDAAEALLPMSVITPEQIARLRAWAVGAGEKKTVEICDGASAGDKAAIADAWILFGALREGWGMVRRVDKFSPRPIAHHVAPNHRSGYRCEIGTNSAAWRMQYYRQE